jgi:glyoxylase-like metal-dependent hydrolase (beta-lactamase superfamily II)
MAAGAVRNRSADRHATALAVRAMTRATNTRAAAALVEALVAVAFAAVATTARAQIEVAGDWDQPGGGIFGFQEEFLDRGGGPDLGDYVGLPINDALRYKASLYSPSWLTVPERQCLPHPSTYQYRSPGGLSIVKEYDPVSQRLVAYQVYGSYGLARTIWMDGRPHPAANERHTYEGFSTGRWDGDDLVVETSHLKAAFIRRNGVAHSDRARMVEHFIRHEDYLTIVTAVDDPLYLDEPFVRSTDYALNTQANTELFQFGGFVNGGDVQGFGSSDVFYKCSPTDEIALEPGAVPSFMPGANHDIDMFAKRHSVPLETALGGSETMYPEYALRLRALRDGATPRPSAARDAQRRSALPDPTPPARSLHVAGQVWLVVADGYNVAVQVGAEGVLVVNPGPEGVVGEVLAEIRKLAGDKRIRVLVNTNDDVVHSGGNAKIGAGPTPKAQRAATIAHERSALRMAAAHLPDADLPTDTFYRGTRELYFNDEPIEVIYVPSATSDGDVLVFFRKSDVVVAGDVIQDLTYPVVRLQAGGTLNGTIAALNRILGITIASWRAEGGTLVIPNRGRVYDEGDVAEYRDVVTIVRDRVRDAIRKGQSLAQIKAARIARDYDDRYGASAGPASPQAFIETAYRSLSGGEGGSSR